MEDSLKGYVTEAYRISVREAFRLQDTAEVRILFLTVDTQLKASLSDGDIRRFILQGGGLDEPAVHAANCKVRKAHSRQEAKDYLDESPNLKAIPVVDDENHIIDIYFGERGSEYPCIDLDVVINAGGKGTRLDPYTRILPKPLIPVGETPVLELIMQEFQKYGCNQFHVIVNYKKELIKAYYAENERVYNVFWHDEEKPLGTGGGLGLLKGLLKDTFFFSNCDTLIRTDYKCILDTHYKNNNLVTMICAYKSMKIPYGIIETTDDGRIQAFKEKPEVSFLTNTGLYIVEPEALDQIGNGENIGFPEVIERLRNSGARVGIYPISEREWLDMGQPEELERMRKILAGEQ